MRLIDADAFKSQIAGMSISNNYPANKANALCELIDAQPAAYNPDKVVEQLEDRKSLMLETFKISESDIDRGRIYGMDKAIEIVKAGETNEV